MISAIIPVYLNEDTLIENLDRLKFNDQVTEVVCVFDGYKPDTEMLWRIKARGAKPVFIYPDIPWGNSRARNIGAINSENDWLLFLDVDHVIENKEVKDLDKKNVYKFKRVLNKTEWHCNTLLMHKDAFFSVGGYYEGFCGNYGYEDRYMEWQLLKSGYDFVHLNSEVFVLNGGGVKLERDKSNNRILFNRLIK